MKFGPSLEMPSISRYRLAISRYGWQIDPSLKIGAAHNKIQN
jgi:hypothetical protein